MKGSFEQAEFAQLISSLCSGNSPVRFKFLTCHDCPCFPIFNNLIILFLVVSDVPVNIFFP
jgi:hypothetical protein